MMTKYKSNEANNQKREIGDHVKCVRDACRLLIPLESDLVSET